MKVEGAAIGLVNQNSIKPGSDNASLKSPVDDSVFRSMSAQYMGEMLFFQFKKLTDPKTNDQYITRDSLYQAAYSNKRDGLPEYEKSMVKELLRRPALLERLDIGQDGKLDNKIDIGNVRLVMKSKEYGALKSESDTYLGKQLQAGFEKFADPNEKGFITTSSLRQAANGVEGFTAKDSLLASEVLRRGLVLEGLAADRNGELDNKTGQVNIQNVTAASDDNVFKSMSDDEITLKFISSFERFLGPRGGFLLSYESLENIANSQGGGSFSAEDSAFARELLSRKPLMKSFEFTWSGKLSSATAKSVFVEKNLHHFEQDYSTGPTFAGKGQRVAYDKDGRELARYDYKNDPTKFGQGSWVMRLP